MDKLIKSTEVMEILSISKSKLRGLVSKGRLHPFPDFKQWRFSQNEVYSYIENQLELAKQKRLGIKHYPFNNKEMEQIYGSQEMQ